MRLTILTQYYPPETGAPQSRLSDLARRLGGRGHDVRVVTGLPNYPTGRVFDEWRGKVVARDTVDGIPVYRSWLYTTPRKSTPRQLASYASFLASATLTAPLRLPRADVVLWESPPLFLAPAAHVLARRLRARLVMNVSDLWPASAVELGLLHNPRLIELFEAWERRAYRAADLVTHQTEGIGRGVAERWPGTPRHLFPNGVDVHHFRRRRSRAAVRDEHGIPADAFVVGYAGNFGRAQALHQVIDAAARLRDVPSVRFWLVGSGPCHAEVADRVASHGLANVRLTPPRPQVEMPEILSSWDAAVVPLADRPIFAGARPSKLFELLAVGVPLVFCGRGEGADIARASGGARLVGPEQPEELAEAVRTLIADGEPARAEAGRRARQFVVERYDRAAIADRMEAVLVDLTRDRTAAGVA